MLPILMMAAGVVVFAGGAFWFYYQRPAVAAGSPPHKTDVIAEHGGRPTSPNPITTPHPILAAQFDHDQKTKPLHIYIECNPFGTPKRVPADGKIYFVGFRERAGKLSGGLGYYSLGAPGDQFEWPRPNQVPVKCTIINDSDVALFNVDVMFAVTAIEVIVDGASRRSGQDISVSEISVQFPRIEPGSDKQFQFYMDNETDHFLEISASKVAHAKVIGSDKIAIVDVTMPKLDELITLSPQ